jgi:predicted double-glycine peptidase
MGGIEKFSVDEFDHLVVYRGTDGRYVYMADPIRGNLRVPTTVFCQAVAEKRHFSDCQAGAQS